ncbi:helix-turn-helix domain-containing protein [Nocardia sp. NPDC088792]|uniref:helix-turn-helix domain-containing protein n=1 Tax=Nocardia sp. NPDC088792 TaxID=3364332 RepID=UPI0038074C52
MTTAQLPATVVTGDDLEYRVPAPEALRPWITEIGHIPTVSIRSAPFTHVPQAVTAIVLRVDASGHRDAMVVGPRTRATYARAKVSAGCLRLRLAPGATQPLLGIPAADLTDRVFRLQDVPGPAADLAGALGDLDLGDVVAYLEDALPQHLSEDSTRRAHRRLLGSAVAALGAAPSVRDLAADLAVSERQLRNLFTAGIGVSPKHYARIDRVRQVIAAAGDTPWSVIASATGYYDQSHMTADFRAIMGVPPTAFFRGDVPAPTPCQALARIWPLATV